MEVQIPSPSAFLQKSPVVHANIIPTPAAPSRKTPKVRNAGSTSVSEGLADGARSGQNIALAKPKQSKSRNGCMTCKKKRLKCDETKPTCQQCHKRGVPCEGYKKDFKWRTFEETTFASKPMTKLKKAAGRADRLGKYQLPDRAMDTATAVSSGSARKSEHHSSLSATNNGSPATVPTASVASPIYSETTGSPGRSDLLQPDFIVNTSAVDLPMYSPPLADVFDVGVPTSSTSIVSDNDYAYSSYSSRSPRLSDLLQPGTDMNQPPDPSESRPPMSPYPYQPAHLDPLQESDYPTQHEEFDEEIVRGPSAGGVHWADISAEDWSFRLPSPAPSESTASSRSSDVTLYSQPSLQASSPEMLMLRFDRQTCGILSVKDGPTENPWRMLIWPLARNSPALYHAILSMTAFHGSTEIPGMRVPGMAHMTKSIKHLANEIPCMNLDAALATSLALAFSEGWDEHVSTGIRHLKGAKVMVSNALVKHRSEAQLGLLDPQETMRLKFLCNTFIYMDVIARLISLEEDNDMNFEEILLTVNTPENHWVEVDPLMGCAATLFPLIGRVANLIQKVRKTHTNSLDLVSQANELKELIIEWQVPNLMLFERPEDPQSEVQHSIQTAEAYRLAILLYLHQAVPEIPSQSASNLAKRILLLIASVPLSSRTNIVQIFPLLAASCEVTTPEDRSWAVRRWTAMMSRLKIGNVDSCFRVVQETWRRRDLHEARKANKVLRRYSSRGMGPGNFIAPGFRGSKRKSQTLQALMMDPGLDILPDYPDDGEGRPAKRRMTFDISEVSCGFNALSQPGPAPLQRRSIGVLFDNLEPDYTVRGSLHWIRVMQDWNWEVFPG